MSEYTGIYVQRLSDGSIYAIQVRDPHGNETSLDAATYVQRGIEPPIDSLPDKGQLPNIRIHRPPLNDGN